MQLQHLKYEQCPVCQAPVIGESIGMCGGRIITHAVNGQRTETQEFLCGYMHQWRPEFSAVRVQRPCSLDPEEVKVRTRREALKSAVTEFIVNYKGEATLGEKDACIEVIKSVWWPPSSRQG